MVFTVQDCINEIRDACGGITRTRALSYLQEAADEIADELRLGNVFRSIGLVVGVNNYAIDTTFTKIYRVELIYDSETATELDQTSHRALEMDHSGDLYRHTSTPRKVYILMSNSQTPRLSVFPAPDTRSLAVTAATFATPIQITSAGHGLANGTRIRIEGVEGNGAANGIFYVGNATANTFDLYADADLTSPVAGTAAYTSGGHIGTATRPFLWVTANSVVSLADSATSYLPRSALSKSAYVHGAARKWAATVKKSDYPLHDGIYRQALARFKQSQGSLMAAVAPEARPYIKRRNRSR